MRSANIREDWDAIERENGGETKSKVPAFSNPKRPLRRS
jgi:hypothetical protein